MKKPAGFRPRRPIGRKVQPVGVRRIEEQLGRSGGEDHMRVGDVHRDVALLLSSKSPTCHSSDPRSGVMCAFGSANSDSR
jgi:hypothetical protein